ncbi:MAG: hypothetical protein QM751_04515 [Paludibacteraceae bacterium]
MSEEYRQLNKFDSALHYAFLAKENINDSANYINYFYDQTIAKNAVDLGYWKEGAISYQKAFELLDKSIKSQLDTRVLELEKKYDLSESRNKKLRAEKRSSFYLALISLLFALVLYFYFYYRQRLIQERLAKKTVEQELVIQNYHLKQQKKTR